MSAPVRSYPAIAFQHRPDVELRDEVLRGLRGTPKVLPPKLFYDDAGSRLFEQICELPEYYLTRTELTILESCVAEIAAALGPNCALVEYGSGAGLKVRLLLDALEDPSAYVPVDISRAQLACVARELAAAYPSVEVRPVCADYTSRFEMPALPRGTRPVAFFPGSTIGNFHPPEAAAFLRRVRHAIGPTGALVLGVDRRKDPAILDAAYNDAQSVTAAFNLNMLTRLNRELAASFHIPCFRHRAFFNDAASRIEMHLVSLTRQSVCVGGETIDFERGETIWTESSYKYDRARLEALVGSAGFGIERLWTDGDERFWVALLTPRFSRPMPPRPDRR
jgi:dimethylhistidine N-methyltransferase